MAYLEVSAFKKLRAFFWALQKSSFNLNKIPFRDNEGTPVDKAYCLTLLRSFPDFQGEAFKEDNTIIKYLSKPGNLKQILDQFTPAQQIELTKVLEEKPAAVAVTGEQPSGQEQPLPPGEPAGTMAGGGTPQIPSFSPAPLIHNVPRVNRPEKLPEVKTYPKPPVIETGLDYEGKPYQVTNAVKNLGSSAQIGIKKASTRLGTIGRAAGGLLGGGIGVGGRALGNFGLKTIDFGARFSSAVGSRGSAFTAAGRGGARFAMVGLLGFVLLTGLLTAFAPSSPGSSPPTATSTSASNFGLDYTLPIRDVSIVPQGLKAQVLTAFPNAQIDNWDVIVEKSIAAGWNPALLLALWIEESGAQGAASYDDPLGCQPGAPTTDINISLNCVFNSYATYTNDQFIEFMTRYGGGTPGLSLEGNANFPKFPNVVKSWYIRLVPSGPGAIKPVLAEALGCPTVGTITNPYGYNITDQPDISYYQCDLDLAGCHSGIDIANGAGTSVSSVFEGEATVVSSDGTKGKHITISNIQTGYSATFEHLNSQIVSLNEKVKRGQVIGTLGATGVTTGAHLHYRLEKNGKIVNPFRYLGSSASIAAISLIQSDSIRENNYQGKPGIFNWGRCNNVP